jgi:hypothetical protein
MSWWVYLGDALVAKVSPIAPEGEQHDKNFADADQVAWQAHLERLGITALEALPDRVQIASEGALWGSVKAHGLLPDTVIVSDDAGQFNVGRHGLCWVVPGWEELVVAVDWKSTIQERADLASRVALEIPRFAANPNLTADHAKYLIRVIGRCTKEIENLVQRAIKDGADAEVIERAEALHSTWTAIADLMADQLLVSLQLKASEKPARIH